MNKNIFDKSFDELHKDMIDAYNNFQEWLGSDQRIDKNKLIKTDDHDCKMGPEHGCHICERNNENA